jgi:hypothetical protein
MAVGFTINHIAAVAFPVLGGVLWMIDYKIPFYFGAAFSGISLIAVQCISGQLALGKYEEGVSAMDAEPEVQAEA